MREIKFRAWHTIGKKMFSAEEMGADQLTLSPDGRGFVNVSGISEQLSHYFPEMIPMQFTGFTDKNGKEIYEGDIVESGNLKGKVCFDENDGEASFRIDFGDGMKTSIYSKETKIIGNIYENSESLASSSQGERGGK